MESMQDFFADIDWSRWGETLWTSAARVLLVVLTIYLAMRVLSRVLEPAIRRMIVTQTPGEVTSEVEERIETLTQVIYRTTWIVAVIIGLVTILPEFGINVNALIAGAGLAGLAIGFGAQNLVKDVIGGIFILVENQFTKGDIVELNGIVGEVEDINLRRTLIRDLDGTVHSMPNGVPQFTSNLTQTFSRVNLQIGVSYNEDLDEVYDVINRVGREMAEDPEWSGKFLSPPEVLGVDEFGDSAIKIRVLGDTLPLEQWAIMREFRKRLKRAFDEAGIEIPYPHQTVVTAGQKAAHGLVVQQVAGEGRAGDEA